MSGRVHPFLYDGTREKLTEFATFLELPIEDKSFGHLLKEGTTLLYSLFKEGKLSAEQLNHLKDVQDPTQKLERKITMFLNEGTIKKLEAMQTSLGVDVHDNANAHYMQMGFGLLYDQWKSTGFTPEQITALKDVFAPKYVYHN